MLVKIEERILIFSGTDFYFPSTSVPPGTFLRLWRYDGTSSRTGPLQSKKIKIELKDNARDRRSTTVPRHQP